MVLIGIGTSSPSPLRIAYPPRIGMNWTARNARVPATTARII